MSDRWLTVDQAGELAWVPNETILRWIREGHVRHVRLGVHSKHIRIRESWLNQAVDEAKARGEKNEPARRRPWIIKEDTSK